MPRINPDVETFARIKVIGAGGSGNNAVDHMIRSKVLGVDFVSINTDSQDLQHSLAPQKIHIGKEATRGLGAGMDPQAGRAAAEENREEITNIVRGTDMVFITCGLGGGTGTGGAPVISDIARNEGALTIGVVTRPFTFEGAERSRIADEGLERLKDSVDAMIVIPNDRLLGIIEKDTSFIGAFAMCDEILRQAVQGISDLITLPGIINVDFADIRAILKNAGSALMGIGRATGDDRAVQAAKNAINSPLLDLSIAGAHGVLFSIAGRDDLTMWEVNEAAKIITEPIAKDAKVIFGAVKDERLRKGEIKITVVASGFTEVPAAAAAKSPSLFQAAPKKEEAPIPRSAKPIKPTDTDDDGTDWDAIPAFLRRSKK
ncbi:MAG: cell division protein FtsZ [bacterium]|nr:cell division protein FtsZ [bacterium]